MQDQMKSLVRLMQFIMKLKRLALLSQRTHPSLGDAGREHRWVPDDVKEGHFAVLAENEEEKKRFVVGLRHLKNPEFLRLLDKAREEYGFRHDGLLVVPCSPDELKKILEDVM